MLLNPIKPTHNHTIMKTAVIKNNLVGGFGEEMKDEISGCYWQQDDEMKPAAGGGGSTCIKINDVDLFYMCFYW